MKPAPFDYAAPERLEEALALLHEFSEDGKVLAGGQSLVPLLALRMSRFDQLIDINRIESLHGIEHAGDQLVIGATTRQAVVGADALVAGHAPLLHKATRYIGHFQIRNRGTIGGSIAHADPTAEYPAAMLALDAEVEVADWRSRRRIAIDDLLESAYETTMEPDELLLSVHVPVRPGRTGTAIREIARRPGDFALVGGVAVIGLGEDDIVDHARLVLFGVSERPIRLTALEHEILGRREPDGDLDEAAARVAADLRPPTDVQATAVYRRQVAGPLAAGLIRDAIADARLQPAGKEDPVS